MESPLRRRSRTAEPTVTQSWHCGDGYDDFTVPSRLVRSFSHNDGRSHHRAFGGIERQPRRTLPTRRQRTEFLSFASSYEQAHQTKPHVVAFVNSQSGGQIGSLLMRTLAEHIGQDKAFVGSVCDLGEAEEPYSTIRQLAGQLCADETVRRLLVCGGDGTVTWILGALEQIVPEDKQHLLPVAVVPLGTGNDLARSLGWGPSLRAVGDMLKYLQMVAQADPVPLDQWRLVLRPHAELHPEHKLRAPGSHPQRVPSQDQAAALRRALAAALGDPEEAEGEDDVYVGLWQNYFSVGMDAKVAGYVDSARNHTYTGKACFRTGFGKLCYAWQGLLHSCCSPVLTESLEDVRTLPPAGAVDRSIIDLDPPLAQRCIHGRRGRLRQLMLVNINSYGAGLNVQPTEHAEPQPNPSDGVVEMLAVRNAMSALCVHARCIRPEYLVSAQKVAFRLTRGEYMQLDGEPWRIDVGCDVLVEPHRKLTMLRAPADAPFWRRHLRHAYWVPDAAADRVRSARGQAQGLRVDSARTVLLAPSSM